MGKYIKTAFANRWNLLALFAACGFSWLSGRSDIFLPIIAAGEISYLAFLGTHPRFRQYVDIQEASVSRAEQSATTQQTLARILNSLSREDRRRFDLLRKRCLDLRQIASDLKPTSTTSSSLDSLQLEGLDRLLWVFLRLLFTRQALNRFLNSTDAEAINLDIRRLRQRLTELSKGTLNDHQQKMRQSVEDTLKTSQERLDNVERAKANCEFVEIEIDRLENKINSLAELTVNRQEPEYISSQVNQVANSMRETERTMNELEFATGLSHADEYTPALVREVQ